MPIVIELKKQPPTKRKEKMAKNTKLAGSKFVKRFQVPVIGF